MFRPVTALTAAAVLAAPAAAAAQAPPYPSETRPHASVSIRTIDNLFVDGLQAQVTRNGGRANVRITLAAHRTGARRAVLRAATCRSIDEFTGCRTRWSRTVRVGASRDARTFTARLPLGRGTKGVRVALTEPGRDLAPRRRTAHAILFLGDEAWTGATAGQAYGATITRPPVITVFSLRFDAVGISDAAVRPTERVELLSDHAFELGMTCTGSPGCAPQPTAIPALDVRTVQYRPSLGTAEPIVGMTGTHDGQPLFSVRVPRPVR